MYTAFYGLREKPFALSPDPRFLYLAGPHREALAHLLYGIEQGEGFISVTGEVGTGKTTLCRTLLERLDGHTELAFLFNPSRTALELLQSICAEFDLPAEGLARRNLMAQLDDFLVEQKQLGRRVLLIIDEAQTLSENTLEQVRLLSNLETSREKLIQILMLGQPELDRKLDEPELRQLRQRISVRWKLEPLSAEETRAYIRHRISIAANEPKELFTESALRGIHRRTDGVPRLINQLCDRALLAGYAARKAQIGPALLRAAAREIPDTQRRQKGRPRRRGARRPWVVVAMILPLLMIASLVGLQVGRHGVTNVTRSVFSPAALTTTFDRVVTRSGIGPTPAVGANAPLELDLSEDVPISSQDPTLTRSTDFVSFERDVDLRPKSVQTFDRGPSLDVVSSTASILSPEIPPSDVITLSPGLLARLLAQREPTIAMAESQRVVLERFGRRVPAAMAAPGSPAMLISRIEERGLVATSFDGGSIELLARLDHPFLIPLTSVESARAARINGNGPTSFESLAWDSDAESVWLAIIGFVGDRARIAGLISEQIVSVPVAEISDHWLATGIIVWERFERVPDLLVAGQQGRGVLWLQRSLAELRFFDGRASGIFSDDTHGALVDFQTTHGLVADGIAGPLTQIALYGQLDRYPVPRLSIPPAPTAQPLRSDASTSPAPGPNALGTSGAISRTIGERG